MSPIGNSTGAIAGKNHVGLTNNTARLLLGSPRAYDHATRHIRMHRANVIVCPGLIELTAKNVAAITNLVLFIFITAFRDELVFSTLLDGSRAKKIPGEITILKIQARR